jgi:hypothetical protein
MRFQWYIVDCDEGSVSGSNDVEEFEELLNDDRYVVLSGQHGKFFNGSRDEQDVEPYIDPDASDEDQDEDEGEGG